MLRIIENMQDRWEFGAKIRELETQFAMEEIRSAKRVTFQDLQGLLDEIKVSQERILGYGMAA